MDKRKQKAPEFLRLTLVPVWKLAFKSYCGETKNAVLIEKATRKLQMKRIAFFGLALIVWAYLFSIVGLTPAWAWLGVKQGTFAAGFVIAFYVLLVYSSYTALLNTVVPKQFVLPDYKNLVVSDKSVHFSQAPDPSPTGFPLGTTGKEWMYWDFDADSYNANIVSVGQNHLYGEDLLNLLFWGALGQDENTVFFVLNSEGGLDFSWLRYDYAQMFLRKKEIGHLFDDEYLAELAQLQRFPNVVIWDESKVNRGIQWLADEMERRNALKSKIPSYEFPNRIVVVLDWSLTAALIKGKDNGIVVSPLIKLLQNGKRLRMNLIAVATPGETWQSMNKAVQPFFSCFEFYHTASFEKKEKEEGKKSEEPEFAGRSVGVSPNKNTCKIWWKGAPRVVSLVEISTKELAEYAYKKAGQNNPQTVQLWTAAINGKPYVDQRERKSPILVNTEPE